MASVSHLPVPKSGKRRHHHHGHHHHRSRRSASEDPSSASLLDNINIHINNNNNMLDDKTSKTRRNEETLGRGPRGRTSRRTLHLQSSDEEPVELPLPPLPVLNDNDKYLRQPRRHHSAPRSMQPALHTANNNNNNNEDSLDKVHPAPSCFGSSPGSLARTAQGSVLIFGFALAWSPAVPRRPDKTTVLRASLGGSHVFVYVASVRLNAQLPSKSS